MIFLKVLIASGLLLGCVSFLFWTDVNEFWVLGLVLAFFGSLGVLAGTILYLVGGL